MLTKNDLRYKQYSLFIIHLLMATDYPQFEVDGFKFHWHTSYYDEEPHLRTDEVPESYTGSSKNAYHLIEHGVVDKAEVLRHRPATRTVADIPHKPSIMMSHFNRVDLIKELKDIIGADCWSMYTTDALRGNYRCFFNTFAYIDRLGGCFNEDHPDYVRIPEYEEEQRLQDALIDDPTPLLDELENGRTLYLILNNWFVDCVFKKVDGQDMYSCCEVRYNFSSPNALTD